MGESSRQYINDICSKYKQIWTIENYKHPYMNEQKCFDRLKSDYEKHGKIIVAFDFDNTIFDYINIYRFLNYIFYIHIQ